MKNKILIVGAGAVGKVYGHFLSLAGIEITFLIKEKYNEPMAKPQKLWDQGKNKKIEWSNYQTTNSIEKLEDHFDSIWFCISTPALKSVNFDEYKSKFPNTACVIFPTGIVERKKYQNLHTNLNYGLIGFMSWNSPLPQENNDFEGLSFYYSSFTPSEFEGDMAKNIAHTLKKNGLPAKQTQQFFETVTYGSLSLFIILKAMEKGGWTFKGIKKNISHVKGAIKSAQESVYKETSLKAPLPLKALPFVFGSCSLTLLNSVTHLYFPFNFEKFFSYHFQKVISQTNDGVAHLLSISKKNGSSYDDLLKLYDPNSNS